MKIARLNKYPGMRTLQVTYPHGTVKNINFEVGSDLLRKDVFTRLKEVKKRNESSKTHNFELWNGEIYGFPK